MSTKKMLIDASHPEETRVAVLQNGKVEDFDFESLSRKPLRGNIYLARITRVEPSLQAAFVEYGGNRHGFLAFNEIHPDYYQIPVSDREVLRKAEALEAELAEALEALEAHEDDEVEPDLNEEDDGLRAVDAEVPDEAELGEAEIGDEAHEDASDATGLDASAEDGAEDGGEARADEAADEVQEDSEEPEPREEEEEEEEREPEEGGDADAADAAPADAGDAGTAGADAMPADYAGEDSAEDAGWHAIEEEEIAALPKDEAERTPEAPDDEDDDAGVDGAADTATLSAAAVAVSTDADETQDETQEGGEAKAEDAADADDADGEAETETKGTGRRRRRRGGRGRRKKTSEAKDSEASGDEHDEADAEARAGDDQGADDEADGNDAEEDDAPARRAKPKKAADPRQKEIQELRRRYEDAKKERAKLLRNYRIQEVIKRRQIMLVQAVKEERGNKGAALTTYMSLAGRYGVLMPNTARGGGVSRKITNSGDRKRLRAAMSEMEIPQGQGLIIRTAGAKRTKAEIKRDYEYLSRLWETIREKTLKSVAPCLIYEEASLIKRAIRDLYDKDTETVLVEGEEGYREAKDFMKMIMPSHAKNVQIGRAHV